jgi:uncharacterized protein (TIGR04255 family)
MPVPEKLKNDAIVEALFEVRFTTSTLPEILFGRISDYEPWKGFEQSVLPLAQIPLAMRQGDPNLRYQPVFALVDREHKRAIRIGTSALVYSRGIPYIGWNVFKPELENVISSLFKATNGIAIERMGLRYLNALRRDLHGIGSIADLNFRLAIAGEPVTANANVNITFDELSDTACTVRIATPDFIQGPLPPSTSVYVDVDVFTNQIEFSTNDRKFVASWIERAHTREKEHFFRLLTKSTLDVLVEK